MIFYIAKKRIPSFDSIESNVTTEDEVVVKYDVYLWASYVHLLGCMMSLEFVW